MIIKVNGYNECLDLYCNDDECKHRCLNLELQCSPDDLRKIADKIEEESKKDLDGLYVIIPYVGVIENNVDIPKIGVYDILNIKVPLMGKFDDN